MSVPNFNPIAPSTAPVPVGQQQPADTSSVPLTAPVMVQKEKKDAGDASGRGLKHGRQQDSANDAYETSTEPVFKKRREVVIEATSSNFAALIEAGDLQAARAMLEHTPELLDAENLSNPDKSTPLCLAAHLGKEDFVAWLIKMSAKVDTPAGNGSTALMFAAQKGHTGVLQQLISHGANVNANNPGTRNMSTALMFAAYAGHTAVLQQLISQGADVNATNPITGGTALHAATAGNKMDALLVLLKSGASVDPPNKIEVTPLMYACRHSFLEVAQLLQAWKANLSARTNQGVTPLMGVARANHLPVVRWLLEQGVVIDETDNIGNTAFMYACHSGSLEVAQLLRQSGANLSARTNDGTTPLILAARANRLPVVRWLLAQGVDVNAAANDGCTPFLLAFDENHVDIAELLLDHGANVDVLPNNGNFIENAVLFEAATRKKYDMLEILLRKRPASFATLASLIATFGSTDAIAKELIQHFLPINGTEIGPPDD